MMRAHERCRSRTEKMYGPNLKSQQSTKVVVETTESRRKGDSGAAESQTRGVGTAPHYGTGSYVVVIRPMQ